MNNRVYGCIEAGGTKFVCAVGSGPDDLQHATFPTTSPRPTIDAVVRYFRQFPVSAVGIGSFGPLDLNPRSSTFGYITSSTPKALWRNFDLAGEVGRALRVPVAIDTDVNAAALGEARWGAAREVSNFVYLTVGTGIGGGAVIKGEPVHGLTHPEMGHIRIPHDLERDPFPGSCPFHGDCLEGLASGPAKEARWGVPAQHLPESHPAWDLEAGYLALGLATWVCTLSPQRIILGGGVMNSAGLLEKIRTKLTHILNGYIQSDALSTAVDTYVVRPQLNGRSGALGAMVLAERASVGDRSRA
jgi:fructokinase